MGALSSAPKRGGPGLAQSKETRLCPRRAPSPDGETGGPALGCPQSEGDTKALSLREEAWALPCDVLNWREEALPLRRSRSEQVDRVTGQGVGPVEGWEGRVGQKPLAGAGAPAHPREP